MLTKRQRIGTIIMVSAAIGSVVVLMLTSCRYCNAEMSTFAWLMYGLVIDIEDISNSMGFEWRDLPTKYLLLIFLVTFALGFLIHVGAILQTKFKDEPVIESTGKP